MIVGGGGGFGGKGNGIRKRERGNVRKIKKNIQFKKQPSLMFSP